jgi:hypothetical protein
LNETLVKETLFIHQAIHSGFRLSSLVDPAPATAPATAPTAAGAMILEIISVSTDVLNYTRILEYLTEIRAYTFKIAFRWTF